MYHRIVAKESDDYLYKTSTTHHDVRDYEDEMKLLSRWLNVISMDELAGRIKRQVPFDEPTIAITFDDGYRDNYSLAFPSLRKYGLPATVYLTAGLIGTDSKLWVDEIQDALLNTRVTSFQFKELFGEEVINVSSLEQKMSANIRISRSLKRMTNYRRKLMLAELLKRLKVDDCGKKHGNLRSMLSWEEVADMANHGVSFGAHTVSHPILTEMPQAEAKEEIIESKRIMEDRLERKVTHFAIPNGGACDFSEDLKAFCIELGFETIVSTEYGWVDHASDPYFLKRFMPDTPIWFFACEVAKLFLFSNRYRNKNDTYGGNVVR